MSDVTRILQSIGSGDPKASQELLPLVYAELRRLAASKMANEKPGQTIQATALVHEAWLKLCGTTAPWKDRRHFFFAAAEAMHRILVDLARRKARPKHGGDLHRTEIDSLEVPEQMPPEEILALDEALEVLAKVDPDAVRLINLRFFAGLSQAEAAQCLGISRSTADRNWAFARAWLFKRLRGGGDAPWSA